MTKFRQAPSRTAAALFRRDSGQSSRDSGQPSRDYLAALFRRFPVAFAIFILFVSLCFVMAGRDLSPSNELRYLSIVDEFIAGGSVFTLSNHDVDYADKPPLYFWLMALSKMVFGRHNIFVLSLFSFLPAMGIIIVMDRWMLLIASRDSGFPDGTACPSDGSSGSFNVSPFERFALALMLGTSVMFLGMTVLLRMDMLMCLFITLSLYVFYRLYSGVGNIWLQRILLPVFIFLALFTKGPVGLLMPLLSISAFMVVKRKTKDIGRYLGRTTWLVLGVLCAGWFLAVWLEGGPEYLDNLLFHQTIDRAVDADYHKEPFWFYLVAFWYVLAPYSILCLIYFIRSLRTFGKASDTEQLFVTVIAVTFIMLSVFSSKLSIYLAPLSPFFICLCILNAKREGRHRWSKTALATPAVILFSAGLLSLAGLPLIRRFTDIDFLQDNYAFAVLSVLTLSSFVSLYFLFVRKDVPKTAVSIALSLSVTVFSASPLLPQVNDYIGYRHLCEVARDVMAKENLPTYSALMVNRAENLDVFLGQQVWSYGRDVYSFLYYDPVNTLLLVQYSIIDKYPALAQKLDGKLKAKAGDYAVYAL